jgi:hypothetical protein
MCVLSAAKFQPHTTLSHCGSNIAKISSPSESSLKIDRESSHIKPIAAIPLSSAKQIVACEDGLEVYQFGGVELVCLEGLQVAGRDHKQTHD